MAYSDNLIMHIALISIHLTKFKKEMTSEDNSIIYNFVFGEKTSDENSISSKLYYKSRDMISNSKNEDTVVKVILKNIHEYFIQTGASENLLQCSQDFTAYIFASASASVLKEKQSNVRQYKIIFEV